MDGVDPHAIRLLLQLSSTKCTDVHSWVESIPFAY